MAIKHFKWPAMFVVAALAVVAVGFVTLGRPGAAPNPATAHFVGGDACIECHQQEHDDWVGSHHDWAMKVADEQSVLADFNDTTFEQDGVKARFFRRDGKYMIHAQGPDGQYRDYEVKYTFGYTPLQQYLVEFDGGRLQAFNVAWETNDKRWFNVQEGLGSIAPDDWLHWSQRGSNWNSMCADCHSTDLKKNYDLDTDTYHTTWTQINVGCEACHGPGSAHVEWAEASEFTRWWGGYDEVTDYALAHTLKDEGRAWGFDEQGKPKLVSSSRPDALHLIETCAPCHARRGHVSDQYRHGDRLLDHFGVQPLVDRLYYPDGQIRDEVYVYGSFVQSKMFHKDVSCIDCHQAHTQQLLAPGNALCTRCHLPHQYDVPAHHHHEPGSTGASCIECHMPQTKYMVVDPRADHSIRIPRPDLAVKIGTPDACTMCHSDQTAQWSADAAAEWYGDLEEDPPQWGPVFAAAWAGQRGSDEALAELLRDERRPGIVRASAATALQMHLSPGALQAAIDVLDDDNPQVRAGAVDLLRVLPPDRRVAPAAPLLDDPVRAVRINAARALVGAEAQLNDEQRAAFDAALKENLDALEAHADNRGGRLALAAYYEERGEIDTAIRHYRAALEMDNRDIDLAMAFVRLLIRTDRLDEAERVLRQLIEIDQPVTIPDDMWARAQGEIRFQLGLLLAGNPQRRNEGIAMLVEATKLSPDHLRIRFNLALAFNAAGNLAAAERELLAARRIDPSDPDYYYALVTIHLEHDEPRKAYAYAQQYLQTFPTDQRARQVMGAAASAMRRATQPSDVRPPLRP